jgi:uncharacterized membrane protein YtjA (UPF0391 family)
MPAYRLHLFTTAKFPAIKRDVTSVSNPLSDDMQSASYKKRHDKGGFTMLRWALVFFVISLLAGVFGFTGIAVGSAAIAKTLFFLALALFVVFLIAGLTVGRALSQRL